MFLVILEKGDRKVKGPKRYLSLFCWKEDTEKRESRLEGEKENEGKVKQPQTANLVFSDYWILNLWLEILIYYLGDDDNDDDNDDASKQ